MRVKYRAPWCTGRRVAARAHRAARRRRDAPAPPWSGEARTRDAAGGRARPGTKFAHHRGASAARARGLLAPRLRDARKSAILRGVRSRGPRAADTDRAPRVHDPHDDRQPRSRGRPPAPTQPGKYAAGSRVSRPRPTWPQQSMRFARRSRRATPPDQETQVGWRGPTKAAPRDPTERSRASWRVSSSRQLHAFSRAQSAARPRTGATCVPVRPPGGRHAAHTRLRSRSPTA